MNLASEGTKESILYFFNILVVNLVTVRVSTLLNVLQI